MENFIIEHWPILFIAGLLLSPLALLPILHSIDKQIRESNRYLKDIHEQLCSGGTRMVTIADLIDSIEFNTGSCVPDKEEEDLEPLVKN